MEGDCGGDDDADAAADAAAAAAADDDDNDDGDDGDDKKAAALGAYQGQQPAEVAANAARRGTKLLATWWQMYRRPTTIDAPTIRRPWRSAIVAQAWAEAAQTGTGRNICTLEPHAVTRV